jgi:hypothetical protein
VTKAARADDAAPADGADALSFAQAAAKARAVVACPDMRPAAAMARSSSSRCGRRWPATLTTSGISRSTVHILPALGDLVVTELSAEQLRRWPATVAAAPAQRWRISSSVVGSGRYCGLLPLARLWALLGDSRS